VNSAPPLAKIACLLPPPQFYLLYVMQLVKVRSCTVVKVICESVSPSPNGYLVFATLFQWAQR
jgi:hypothetical protein